jgi:hypothetical protein
MAGVKFPFNSFENLIDLNIGISNRLDENRAESFTILYCNLTGLSEAVIDSSIKQTLRDSDSYTHHEGHFFFIFPFTDKYGAITVRGMLEEFFDSDIEASEVSFPADGENARELIEEVQMQVSSRHASDLHFLDPMIKG